MEDRVKRVNAPMVTWDEEKAIRSDLQSRAAQQAELERQEAYRAVSVALAKYRWWHWNSIVPTVLLWIQSWRSRK